MGAGECREYDQWPPPFRATSFFLHPGSTLSTETPPGESPPGEYLYDPADPTPYWLISCRRPDALVSALEATRTR